MSTRFNIALPSTLGTIVFTGALLGLIIVMGRELFTVWRFTGEYALVPLALIAGIALAAYCARNAGVSIKLPGAGIVAFFTLAWVLEWSFVTYLIVALLPMTVFVLGLIGFVVAWRARRWRGVLLHIGLFVAGGIVYVTSYALYNNGIILSVYHVLAFPLLFFIVAFAIWRQYLKGSSNNLQKYATAAVFVIAFFCFLAVAGVSLGEPRTPEHCHAVFYSAGIVDPAEYQSCVILYGSPWG